ncbi:MAG: ATP synthase F1 subunit epsilon [Bacteroidota bacterium]|nr:ATP synthase F1 subunit epsilon [Bacteroidota bacterium]
MYIEIVSPEKKLYSGDVDYVQLPGTKGRFAILKNHAPLISTLTKGTVLVRDKSEQEKNIDISGGVVEVMKNNIIVLAK